MAWPLSAFNCAFPRAPRKRRFAPNVAIPTCGFTSWKRTFHCRRPSISIGAEPRIFHPTELVRRRGPMRRLALERAIEQGGIHGDQGIQAGHDISRTHGPHHRGVGTRVARSFARQEGRAERAVHRHRRHGLWAAWLLRRADQHAQHRQARQERPAVHRHAHDGSVRPSSRGARICAGRSGRSIRRRLSANATARLSL